MDNFSEWLNTKLAEAGYSQAEFSRLTGITSAHLSRLISGQRKPGNDAVLAIAKAFKLPPEDVFRAAGILPPKLDPDHDPTLAEWMNLFNQADPQTQDQLLDLARALSQFKDKGK